MREGRCDVGQGDEEKLGRRVKNPRFTEKGIELLFVVFVGVAAIEAERTDSSS